MAGGEGGSDSLVAGGVSLLRTDEGSVVAGSGA